MDSELQQLTDPIFGENQLVTTSSSTVFCDRQCCSMLIASGFLLYYHNQQPVGKSKAISQRFFLEITCNPLNVLFSVLKQVAEFTPQQAAATSCIHSRTL